MQLQGEARAKILEGAQLYLDAVEPNGGAVTGFVLIVESYGNDGTHDINWASGDGSPITDSNRSGLPRWRTLGLLEDVTLCIKGAVTAWYVRNP